MSAREVTASAPANIAFVKYWGSRDVEQGVPLNRSVSMTLSICRSLCTARFEPGARDAADAVFLVSSDREPRPAPADFARPVLAHLGRIRRWAGVDGCFRVATRNTFPTGAGLASSASGFAALTLAAAGAAGREPSPGELSDLARRSGSGSAARSALGGYVEWPAPDAEGWAGCAPAVQLNPATHWDLRDLIAVVAEGPKEVSSREAHHRVLGSPYFETRQALLAERSAEVKRAIAGRDFERLVRPLEAEAVDLHFLAMSSRPPIHYWVPGTLAVIEAVRELRSAGVPAAWTMDAGPNVHVICPAASEEAVAERLSALEEVRRLIRDRVGPGPTLGGDSLL